MPECTASRRKLGCVVGLAARLAAHAVQFVVLCQSSRATSHTVVERIAGVLH